MPTAVEYALPTPWHTQDGCATGSPRLNLWHTQNGIASGPLNSLLAGQEHVVPDTVFGDWQVTGVFAAPLVLVAVVVAVRRRVARRSVRWESAREA